jgi:hypothetical protein
MEKLHQSSILILATILFSTSSLSGCRNPSVNNQAMKELQYAAKEFAKRFPKEGLQQEKVIATSIFKQPASQELTAGIAIMQVRRQRQVVRSAYIAAKEDLYSSGFKTSIDDLRKIAFQNASQEAKSQGLVLTDFQLNEIADTAARFAHAEIHVLVTSYSAAVNNLHTNANNASLEELKVAAFQAGSEDAKKQGISLTDEKLQVIATAAATAAWQEYQQQQKQGQQSSS